MCMLACGGRATISIALLCVFVSFGIAAAVSGLPYSEDKLWVLEYGKAAYTLPYSGETSMPELSIYRGIIRNVDGSPAAYAGFYAQIFPTIKESDEPVSIIVGAAEINAGADGRFQFATMSSGSNHIYMTGKDIGNAFVRSQEEYELKPDKENILVSRRLAEVPARLVKANGSLLQLKEPPEIYSTDENQTSPGKKLAAVLPTITQLQDPPQRPTPLLKEFEQYSSLGTLRSLAPYKWYRDADFNMYTSSIETPFILRRVAVPGRYSMLAMGRVFKPFTVSTTSTEVYIYEDARPFTLSGTVTDMDGTPVQGAFIQISNGGYSNWLWKELQYDIIRQLWEITAGDFDRLGFYLARTDEEGRFEVSGNCVGSFSTLKVYADGYELLKKANFLPDVKRSDAEDEKSYSEMMFEGEATLQPLVIASTAVVTDQISTERGSLTVPQNALNFAAQGDVSKVNLRQLCRKVQY